MNTHLHIVGQGIRGLSQITLQGIQDLKSSRKILFLHVPLDEFKSIQDQYSLPEAESLSHLYVVGDIDQNNYKRIHDRTIEALETLGEVSLLLQGHPLFGVLLARILKKTCDEKKIPISVSPGISSFDSMMIDLFRDPLEPGTVVIDANRLLLFSHPISAGLDHYIYHVSSVANARTDLSNPHARNHVEILTDYLLKYFPADHPVKLIVSAIASSSASDVHEIKLRDLSQSSRLITSGTTMFVPGLKPTSVNRDYLAMIRESEG